MQLYVGAHRLRSGAAGWAYVLVSGPNKTKLSGQLARSSYDQAYLIGLVRGLERIAAFQRPCRLEIFMLNNYVSGILQNPENHDPYSWSHRDQNSLLWQTAVGHLQKHRFIVHGTNFNAVCDAELSRAEDLASAAALAVKEVA